MTQHKDGKDGQAKRNKARSRLAFDEWLNRGLHELFDDVAKEPIPEELLKLIEDDQG